MTPKSCNKYVKRWKTVKRQIEKAVLGILVWEKWSHTIAEPHNQHYKNLQKCYLLAFYLATFADWLQGPYVYKLYSDYGYSDDSIAILYITGFASSCVFGTIVGQMADKYGRKILCTSFGVLYSLCCLSKTSSNFVVLLIGRVLGGISTSILFTTFEAWYLNEHLNFFKMPPEWLNITFTKATFYNGLSAILAGIVSQIFAEYLDFGPVSPFLIAVPFLLLSLLVIQSTWKEHSALQTKPVKESSSGVIKRFFSPLLLLMHDDKLLLYLGIVQSVFEAVMYTFIFSWTPILTNLKPPLGIVFSLFMIALMIGSKLYAVLISNRYQPQNLLIFSSILAAFSFVVVSLSLTTIVIHVTGHYADDSTVRSMRILCFFAFLLYEFSIGMYFPAVGYLRGRVVPEECRATLTNWFRVPMNLITCLSLTLKQATNHTEITTLKKFQFVFCMCSVLLLITVAVAWVFSKKYARKVIQDELSDVRAGKVPTGETV